MKKNINNEEMNKINESNLKSKDEQIALLWGLLDDISTAVDMFKPEIDGYFKYVNEKCERRSEVANSCDGFSLQIIQHG